MARCLGMMAIISIMMAGLFLKPSWAENLCGEPRTAADLIVCLEEKSPEIQRAKASLAAAEKLVGVAGQIPNPELSAQFSTGKIFQDDDFGGQNVRSSETEVAIVQPIELGGKRSSRKETAKAKIRAAEADLYAARATGRILFLTQFNRLKQLLSEQVLIDEALGTFTKLVGQYQRRPALSPEQEVTVAVFRLAADDYRLRKAEVDDEVTQVHATLALQTGLRPESFAGYLPSRRVEWPTFANDTPLNTPFVAKAEAQVNEAQADLKLAKSESWPILKLGPFFRLETTSNTNDPFYGLQFESPIPVLNLNRKGRAYANQVLMAAETNLDLAKKEQHQSREALLRIYQRSVAILSSTLTDPEVQKKHEKIERLFFQGVVPSALVIEAHRQLVDFETNRNARELAALKAMWGLYALEGKLTEIVP